MPRGTCSVQIVAHLIEAGHPCQFLKDFRAKGKIRRPDIPSFKDDKGEAYQGRELGAIIAVCMRLTAPDARHQR